MRRVLLLTERATHDSRSHLRAAILGGPEHIGWGPLEHLTATLVDAVNLNTVITARVGGSKKAKAMPPMPRPGDRPVLAARSIAELNVAQLAAQTA